MPRIGPIERAERVTRFLFGLRHPRIAEALASRGFRDANIEEGWRLLRAATRTRMPAPSEHGDEGAANRYLMAWCKEWVPMFTVTLRRHHPKALINREALLAVAGNARVFVVMEWLKLLRDPESELAKASPGAFDVLVQRGLTPSMLAQVDGAQAVLSRDGSAREHQPTVDELTAADEELWAYYMEWIQAARMVVKDRRLLRRLGLLRTGGGGSSGDDGAGEASGP